MGKPERELEQKDALKFILAGKSEFTLLSKKSGVSFAYKIKKATSYKNPNYFVYMLTLMRGTAKKYAGVVRFDYSDGKFTFKAKEDIYFDDTEAKMIKGLLFVLNHLYGNQPMELTVYHHGRCGACNKPLTTPESILTGLGPVCSKNLNIPRVKVAS